MLVAFNGGHHNIHEVQMVTKGERWTIGSFWDNEEAEYDEAKRALWEEDIAEQRKRQADDAAKWAEMKERGERMLPGPDQTDKKEVALKVGGNN
jgi:predicted 2-oxoglutarate/Fe(II)-dependent dioxygenase YbiX